MKVVFMGTPEFAVKSLEKLLDSRHEVSAVVCPPDRAADRGRRCACAVKIYAEQKGLRVLQYASVSRDGVDALKALGPDVIVTCAFGQMLSNEILSLAPLGVLNVHASLLPKYRGASPVQSAIISGERVTGISIMKTVAKMDAGDVILQRATEIGEDENFGELFGRLSVIGAGLLDEALSLVETGEAVFAPQNEAEVTYCRKITKETEKIDFSKSAAEIINLIRGLSPAPGAYAFFNGKRLKILSAGYGSGLKIDAPCGTVLKQRDKLFVRAGDGMAIELKEVQPQDGKRMDVKSFCNGRKIDGSVLE